MGKHGRKKVALSMAVVMGVLLVCATALAFSTANDVVMESSIWKNSIRASFYANRNTGSDPVWGAQANKHIKQCYVRLIEGNYDTGRLYSPEACCINDGVMKTVYTAKDNDLFHTCYTYYGWNQYF